MLQTSRLVLEAWGGDHREAFAAMNADPEVMWDLGGPIGREESDAKFQRYREGLDRHGTSRWAVLSHDGVFLGYSGVMFRSDADHPLGAHHELGWRLVRSAWGHGYASESAVAALEHAFREVGLMEAYSYTAPENLRSQRVMERVGLKREPTLDFKASYPGPVGGWHGLVWSASAKSWPVKDA